MRFLRQALLWLLVLAADALVLCSVYSLIDLFVHVPERSFARDRVPSCECRLGDQVVTVRTRIGDGTRFHAPLPRVVQKGDEQQTCVSFDVITLASDDRAVNAQHTRNYEVCSASVVPISIGCAEDTVVFAIDGDRAVTGYSFHPSLADPHAREVWNVDGPAAVHLPRHNLPYGSPASLACVPMAISDEPAGHVVHLPLEDHSVIDVRVGDGALVNRIAAHVHEQHDVKARR